MKNASGFIFVSSILISFVSCSSDTTPKSELDSVMADSSVAKKIIQTDSGKIVVATKPVAGETKATLFDKDGKISQTGMYINDKPAGAWIKYDAAGNIISAEHYSGGKPLMQLDKNDFIFRNWDNQKIGLKFKVPKDWKELPTANPRLIVSFEKQNIDSATVHIKPNFTVVKGTLQPGENLETLAKMQIDLLHKNYDRVEIVDESNIVVDSCSSFRRYGMYYTGNEKAGFLDVIIVEGINVWFFSCEAQNNQQAEFLKYQGVFQEILESIRRAY